jgi:branched-chain amino acid transport system permease protein
MRRRINHQRETDTANETSGRLQRYSGVLGGTGISRLITAILIIVVLVIPVFVKNPFILHLLIVTVFYAYISSSWNIVGGLAGQISLGHSVYVGIGAYTSTLLYSVYGVSPWIGMLAGGILAAIVSLIISYPCLRLQGVYYTLATIAFAETFRLFIFATERIGPFHIKAAQGLLVPLRIGFINYQFVSKAPYYYIILVLLAVVLAVTHVIKKTKLGFYLAAVRENQSVAQALGINTTTRKITAAAISAFFTGLGGTFFAQYILMVDPFTILGIMLSVTMVIMPIVGGVYSTFGPLLGTLILVPISELTTSFLGGRFIGFNVVLYGIAIVVAIYFLPQGLAGIGEIIRSRRVRTMDAEK